MIRRFIESGCPMEDVRERDGVPFPPPGPPPPFGSPWRTVVLISFEGQDNFHFLRGIVRQPVSRVFLSRFRLKDALLDPAAYFLFSENDILPSSGSTSDLKIA